MKPSVPPSPSRNISKSSAVGYHTAITPVSCPGLREAVAVHQRLGTYPGRAPALTTDRISRVRRRAVSASQSQEPGLFDVAV
ncbi:hypothetical protein [Nocardia brevicatena]|uniref:hypothetical protein n=1 Tax=Nocardia brevicatena TaxID=37327 RepID=UPI0002D3C11F|nr:hypothetical protein [Nocardia brevicatena]